MLEKKRKLLFSEIFFFEMKMVFVATILSWKILIQNVEFTRGFWNKYMY